VIQVQPKAPHPMDSAQVAKAKVAKVAKATARAKVAHKAGLAESPRFLPTGAKAECQVLIKGTTQCSNPWNHDLLVMGTKRGSCTTHGKIIANALPDRLARFRFTKAIVAYDKSLWSGDPKDAPQVAHKAPKAKSGPVVKVAPTKAPVAKASAPVAPVAPPVPPVAPVA